jgi:pimeloyl-ACP methyl ester carboxylesterase
LIVFVPPWRDARLPEGWGEVLDRHGIIFVSAENSGNDQNVLGRRIPLALLAEQNVVRRYKIDPSRVYIAGFSGGSRVASRIALGYPDIFQGAIMDAGADTFGGDGGHPLPSADLVREFQEASRLVYIAGGNDAVALAMDDASKHSAEELCAFHVNDVSMPFSSHGAADAQALSQALDILDAPAHDDTAALAECRSRIESELNDKVQQVRTLQAAGRRDEARNLIEDINARFGGLAAKEIQELTGK